MYRFVAFLRGINVGGHIVAKEKLKEVFTSLGYQNFYAYKQSGNVIFEAETTNTQELESQIGEKLRNILGFEVAVFLRSIPQLRKILALDPFKGQNREGASFLVTFLSGELPNFPLQLPATISKSTAQVISSAGSEVFSVTHGGGEGALPNPFVESMLNTKATTRNLNIIREIAEKFGP